MLFSKTDRCPRTVGRRDVLRAGFLGLTGLGLSKLLRMQARGDAPAKPAQFRSCVFVWLMGGPSHLETYDMKPDAPDEYRGPYRPIRTRVPGIEVCELMPRHARVADRFTLIRSCSHGFSGHQDGSQHVLTGWPAVLAGGGTETSVYPEIGAVIKKLRPQGQAGLPNYVTIPSRLTYAGPAYLGKPYEPFVAGGDLTRPEYKVPNLSLLPETLGRLGDRRALRKAFDEVRRDIDGSGAMEAMDGFDREAVRLLTGAEAQRACDLSRCDPRERDRYGRCLAGQSLLLARRLTEAGVGFVTVKLANFSDVGVDGSSWDDHAGGCNLFERMKRRLPVYDQALTALIEDLYDRGLDRRVLLVVLGEFGRTPFIVNKNNEPGREHWPGAMSILVAGGGTRTGQVIGSTSAKAESPKTRPLQPPDLLATIYRFLGIDPTQQFQDRTGRPLAILPAGEAIRELLG